MPSGSARPRMASTVCGSASASTTYTPPRLLETQQASVIASAAAVPSSSIDTSRSASPVRSATIVWKLSSASRRPWLISGWYAV